MASRLALSEDVPAIISLLEQKRAQLETWEPRFWRRSENAAALSQAHFNALISDPAASVLVFDVDGAIAGCLQYRPFFVPPVYAPGGTTWMVDDFVVLEDDWSHAGKALLQDLYARTIQCEPSQLVFPVPYKDEAANAFFVKNGLSQTTVWYTVSD